MLINNKEYLNIIDTIKEQIRNAQYRVLHSANSELIMLYWNIGKSINSNKIWGNKFIDTLACDIKLAFPESTGYSVRNLKYMAKFANVFSEVEIVQTVLAQLSWYHNTTLLDKINDASRAIWYAQKCFENGWSRNVLVHQIELKLYERQQEAIKSSNFMEKLAYPQNELALQMLKDPYIFDFVSLKENIKERDIEQELIKNVAKLLLELGTGFAFLGNQFHLEIDGKDFYIDLLFYNLNLRCYVVIELKTGDFEPTYAGQLNFYLSAVDALLKKEHDNPSIGILLCKNKSNVIVEFALKDISKPIGVSEYILTQKLPQDFAKNLPSIEDIENRI